MTTEDHDWHLFDVERGYEVRRQGNVYEVRKQGREEDVTELTEQEFADWREHGKPNPKGLK